MKREMKRVKKFGVILVPNKSEERSEKSGFLFIPLFLREREFCVKKFSLSERNFFVHVRFLNAVFCNF